MLKATIMQGFGKSRILGTGSTVLLHLVLLRVAVLAVVAATRDDDDHLAAVGARELHLAGCGR